MKKKQVKIVPKVRKIQTKLKKIKKIIDKLLT